MRNRPFVPSILPTSDIDLQKLQKKREESKFMGSWRQPTGAIAPMTANEEDESIYYPSHGSHLFIGVRRAIRTSTTAYCLLGLESRHVDAVDNSWKRRRKTAYRHIPARSISGQLLSE